MKSQLSAHVCHVDKSISLNQVNYYLKPSELSYCLYTLGLHYLQNKFNKNGD